MKQIMKILASWFVLCISLQSCYTNRPIASNVTAPDYNKRVNVAGAGYRKKGNAINVVFNVGMIGAGAYGGYNINLVQQQTENGKEPVKVANAAIGALAGASVAYLIDQIAGKNKVLPLKSPDDWIRKANKEYRFLAGSGPNFTIIHPSAERNYMVRNMQDVIHFKDAFPNSNYTDNIARQVFEASNLSNIAQFSTLYPQYSAQSQARYLSLSLSNSNTFAAFKANIDRFPESLDGVNLKINYQNEEEIKTLFAQLNSRAEDIGTVKLRKFKNEILDDLLVIHSIIDKEYEDAEYGKITNSASYTDLLKFTSKFPNSTYTASVTERANILKYNSYKKDYQLIEKELASIRSQIDQGKIINTDALDRYLTGFSYYTNYDPDNVSNQIASAQEYLKYAKYYAAYKDVQQTVDDILQGIEKGEYLTSRKLVEKIDYFNRQSSSDPDNVRRYIDNASKLSIILDGMTVPIPDSYREFSIGGATIGVIGAIVSGGNLRGMTLAKPMNTALFNEHKSIIDKGVDIFVNHFGVEVSQGNNIYFGDNIAFTNESWNAIGRRLIKNNEEIYNTYNKDVDDHNKLLNTLSTLSGSSSSSSFSSSSSMSSSNSSSSEIDPDNVSIPSYRITTNWTDRSIISINPGDQYLQAKFSDGTEIEISRYNFDKIPFVRSGSVFGSDSYETDDYAIKAAYVWKKYGKLRKTGQK